jgi:hypothetical protein
MPPENWTVSGISHEGTYDALTRKVKWGPFFDDTARTLTYEVMPPADTTGTKQFQGTASADGENSPIGGPNTINRQQALYHPADNNPTNHVLSVNELTAYASAWKRGATWPIAPNPIPINYVTRAAVLWKGGETYRYDPNAGQEPFCWVNTQARPLGVAALDSGVKALGLNNTAVSELPPTYLPGVSFTVTITVTPAPDMITYAVEDQPPAGWSVSAINEAGQFDQVNHKVKWLFFDDTPRTLSYQVTPPANASGNVTFAGVAAFDSLLGGPQVPISGQRQTTTLGSNIPLKMLSIERQSGGAALLMISGTPGLVYEVEASTDMQQWTKIGTVTPAEGLFQFVDQDARQMDTRFYRARSGFVSADVPAAVINCAVATLARYLAKSESFIQVLDARPAVWSDSSLGCPEPGHAYLDVITGGYQITLMAEGALYELHTNSDGRFFVLCLPPDPAKPGGLPQGKSLGGCGE